MPLQIRAQLGPGRAADECRMQRRVAVVMEPGRAELSRLHPTAGAGHSLEHDHAAAGVEEVGRRNQRVVAGADADDVGLVWKIVYVVHRRASSGSSRS